MMDRIDQSTLFNKIVNDITLNTKPDSSGEDINTSVNLYWGHEPKEQDMPCVILKFITFSNPIERSIGNIVSEHDDGILYGFMVEDILMIKVKAIDIQNDYGYLSKQDIGQYIMRKIYENIIWGWNKVLKNSVVSDNISPITDISSIIDNQNIYELQLTVGFKNFEGSIPKEEGILDNNAPYIDKAQAYIGILPNTNTILTS